MDRGDGRRACFSHTRRETHGYRSKYNEILDSARLSTDGIVEKPDIVGAIFGQTEGLLGDELDLRDLQKSGRIGRIEVEVSSSKGKSEGIVYVPSSLDQVETAILASALETIDRVGPCKARISVDKIEDVRVSKRNKIVERAKQLLNELMKASKTSGGDLTDSVRQSFQMEEVVHYGKERLPAGPNIDDSDAIIVVEGRSDVAQHAQVRHQERHRRRGHERARRRSSTWPARRSSRRSWTATGAASSSSGRCCRSRRLTSSRARPLARRSRS